MTAHFQTRSRAVAALAMGLAMLTHQAAAAEQPMSRVRDIGDTAIAELIADGIRHSATFRALTDLVDATDGIVYVESGGCRLGARACLTHNIQVSGPNRILRIVVNTRRDRQGLIGAIGHELQHAMEVLRNPAITTTQGMFFHLFGASLGAAGRFETRAAVDAGLQIEHEIAR